MKRRKKVGKISLLLLFRNYLIFVFSLLAFISLAFIIVKSRQSVWRSCKSLQLVSEGVSGNSQLTIINKEEGSVVIFNIPDSVKLESPYSLGFVKLKSLWRLSEKDDYSGNIVPLSFLKTLNIPVFFWARNSDMDFSKVSMAPSSLSFITNGANSNLNIYDRLRIVIYLLFVPEENITLHDFTDMGILQKVLLVDNTESYLLKESLPVKYISYFADPKYSKNTVKMVIWSKGVNSASEDIIEKVIENLGVKPIVKNDYSYEGECIIKGTDRELILKFNKILPCKTENKSENYDFEILLGKEAEDVFR